MDPLIRWGPGPPWEGAVWGTRCGLMLALLWQLVIVSIVEFVVVYCWEMAIAPNKFYYVHSFIMYGCW